MKVCTQMLDLILKGIFKQAKDRFLFFISINLLHSLICTVITSCWHTVWYTQTYKSNRILQLQKQICELKHVLWNVSQIKSIINKRPKTFKWRDLLPIQHDPGRQWLSMRVPCVFVPKITEFYPALCINPILIKILHYHWSSSAPWWVLFIIMGTKCCCC